MLYNVMLSTDKDSGMAFEAMSKLEKVWKIERFTADEDKIYYDVHGPLGLNKELAGLPGIIDIIPIRHDLILDLNMPDEACQRLLNLPTEDKEAWGLLYTELLPPVDDGKTLVRVAFDTIKLHVMTQAHKLEDLTK